MKNKITSQPGVFQSTFMIDYSQVVETQRCMHQDYGCGWVFFFCFHFGFLLVTCVAEKLDIKPQDRSKFFGVGGRNLRKLRSETGECHHHHHHLSLNHESRWGTTDDFATSFLHFSLFSAALWDSLNSRPLHCLMLSSHLFLSLPCLFPPFTVPCKVVLARPDEWKT